MAQQLHCDQMIDIIGRLYIRTCSRFMLGMALFSRQLTVAGFDDEFAELGSEGLHFLFESLPHHAHRQHLAIDLKTLLYIAVYIRIYTHLFIYYYYLLFTYLYVVSIALSMAMTTY